MTGAQLRRRAEWVIPGGVNSGQRSLAGIDDLVIAEARGAHIRDLEVLVVSTNFEL
jgi:glutamate-1-semialdehyde 2,1-aminomutase